MTCSRACLQGDLPAGVTSSRRGSDCGMDGADCALATGGSSPPASAVCSTSPNRTLYHGDTISFGLPFEPEDSQIWEIPV